MNLTVLSLAETEIGQMAEKPAWTLLGSELVEPIPTMSFASEVSGEIGHDPVDAETYYAQYGQTDAHDDEGLLVLVG